MLRLSQSPAAPTRPGRRLLVAAALFLVSFATSASAATAPAQPNILFIFADDHALDAISAYGGPLKDIAKTPHIDRIRDEGVLFTRSYCSNSICGPSRAAILTGKHSHINGFMDNEVSHFDSLQSTFPKLLQKSGYETALIGKWHLESTPAGFDHWEILPGQGSYYHPDFLTPEGRHREVGYCTDLITDKALTWLKERADPNKPFLLMAQHKAPHRNWAPAPRHYDLFKDVDFPLPSTFYDNYSGRSEALGKQKMRVSDDLSWGHDMKFHGPNQYPEYFTTIGPNAEYSRMTDPEKAAWDAAYGPENEDFLARMNAGELDQKAIDHWKFQRYIKDYLRTIRAVDEGVGRLLAYLDESGLANNTLVIYSSDQGFYLGEHGWYDKRWMFEESLSMPFIARWPGTIPAGSNSNVMIQNIDYAPTFLEIAGAEIPSTIQGASFLPVLKDPATRPDGWREGIYYFYSGEQTHQVAAHDGVRNERYKLIRFPSSDEWNLFDLETDPDELRSIHNDPEAATILSQMRELYDSLRARYQMSEATVPAPRNGEEWWKDRHLEKAKQARSGPHEIVFIGDSITQGWEGAGANAMETKIKPLGSVLNLGFSGDRTQHVLWRMMNGEMEGQKPKVAIVMIGTNNTGHVMQAAEDTADGVRLIVRGILDRSPGTSILLHPIFPRGADANDPHRILNDQVNALVKPLAEDPRVQWLDISNHFMDAEGKLDAAILPDLLHPRESGYEIWADELVKILPPLLAAP